MQPRDMPPTKGSIPSHLEYGGNSGAMSRLQDADTFWGLLLRSHSLANHPTRPLGDNHPEPTDTVPQTPIRATCDGCQTRWRAGKYFRHARRGPQEHVGIGSIYYCLLSADPTNGHISSVVPNILRGLSLLSDVCSGGLTVDSGEIYPKSTIPQFPTCKRTADPHPVSTTCLLVVDMSLVSNPHRHETPSPFLTTKSTEFLALHRPVPASTRLLGFRHTVPASGDRDKPRFFF